MTVLVVVSTAERLESFLTSAFEAIDFSEGQLFLLCWTQSAIEQFPLFSTADVSDENDQLVARAREIVASLAEHSTSLDADSVQIQRAMGPDLTASTLAAIREVQADLVIADGSELPATMQSNNAEHPLLRRAPCEVVLFRRIPETPARPKRVLVLATDSPHDQAVFQAMSHRAPIEPRKILLARLEDEVGTEAVELGRRELKRLMRAAGVKAGNNVKRRVFSRDAWQELLDTAEASRLVVLGANQEPVVRRLSDGTQKPAIAIIRRAPPLKRFGRVTNSRWKTKLSPGDYADMIQGLRRGANLSSDYLIMLGLASAIASLGLLQNSPAVVIGSMLLAPLMTPMIACGLAIAQGSKKLGRRSMASIAVGFLLTLAISFIVAVIAPGQQITAEIVARGDPNSLDLMIALCSAVAAAYALSHPGVVGAIAGVAIATALVPPLCSVGISLAYREYLNAYGAALLFATNLVAIILGAAATFRMLGVTMSSIESTERRWVFRITTAMCLAVLTLSYPLHLRLNDRIDAGQTQPRTYPLAKVTEDALVDFIEKTPDVELVSSGRPSTLNDRVDVVLVVSSMEPLPREFADELVRICREKMDDAELVVDVHCFLNAWAEE